MTAPEYRDYEGVEDRRYPLGAGFDYDGSGYPYSISPSQTIEVLHITSAGNIVAACTLESGATVSIPLAGGVGIIDWLSIDSIEFQDPNGTTARLAGAWAGE
jgi:hypothetical protein